MLTPLDMLTVWDIALCVKTGWLSVLDREPNIGFYKTGGGYSNVTARHDMTATHNNRLKSYSQ